MFNLLPKVEVEYRRLKPVEHSVTLNVVIAATTRAVEDEYGLHKVGGTRDYLLRAIDLILDGSQVEPKAGDVILETIAGKIRTYQVMSLAGGEAWRYSDRYYNVLRVHTKQIDEQQIDEQ